MPEKKVPFFESTPIGVKKPLIAYGILTAVLTGFTVLFILKKVMDALEIVLMIAAFGCLIYGIVKAVMEGKHFVRLYEDRFETQEGSFSYKNVKKLEVSKGYLLYYTDKKRSVHVANADEVMEKLNCKVKEVRRIKR